MSSSDYGFRKLSQIKIGTFNVHGLSTCIKQRCIAEDMNRYELDILCLQETKIKEEKTWIDEGYKFIMMGSDSKDYGNGFVISPRLASNIVAFKYHTDRISSINPFAVKIFYQEIPI